ncbi:MAG: ADP-ribosylglycohydrolase family protein [Armatimonadota bacterium]
MDDRLAGTLLGTALGDALGLPAEGMPAHAISRRFGRLDRYRLLGATGFVSDDTEQSALVAQSLVRHPRDAEACARDFRRALLGWFLRLPWGVGLATVRACLKAAVGMRRTGVRSAGNGAAMRAAVVGVYFRDRPEERRRFGRLLAEVTHTDPRAVDGALFTAEVAALCARAERFDRSALTAACAALLDDPALVTATELRTALAAAIESAGQETSTADAAARLGTSGYVVHTVSFALFCLLRHGADPLNAVVETVNAGGDTDSIGAVVGAWVGALHGEAGLPLDRVDRIHDGPFGPSHLRALASCLAQVRGGERVPPPRYSVAAALGRNLSLYPVVLYHGFRRLLPF